MGKKPKSRSNYYPPPDMTPAEVKEYFRARGTVVVQTYIPATNPRPENIDAGGEFPIPENHRRVRL